MLSLEWPWLLLLLPLPWLYRRWRRPSADHQAALQAPLYRDWVARRSAARRAMGKRSPWGWLLAILWISTLLAASRPVWIGEPVLLPAEARELMLAVDLSGSMREPDMVLGDQRVDRLTALKAVLHEFIARRHGDRIGLMVFGGRPYVQAPLTHDHQTLQRMLDNAWIGLATDGTAIGDAIGLAVKQLRERPEGNRVLILLTDGANTMGNLDPLEAATLAAHFGIRIHTIGFGSERTPFWGGRASEIDESSLAAIARETSGRFFRARSTEDLENIYRELDRLEPVTQDPEALRPQRMLSHWLLAISLGALLLILLRPVFSQALARLKAVFRHPVLPEQIPGQSSEQSSEQNSEQSSEQSSEPALEKIRGLS